MEPPPGRATLRSFRGVVRHRNGALPRSGALGGRHPRTARLSAARPQLRVDRPARPRDLRLSPERPLGIRRAIARSRAARAQGGLRHATRAGPQLCRSVRRLHGPRDRLRRWSTCARSATTTGGCRSGTSGRSSACCSTIRTARSAAPIEHIDRLRRALRRVQYDASGSKPVYYRRTDRWTPIPRLKLNVV